MRALRSHPATPFLVTSFALSPTPVPPDTSSHVEVRLYGASDVGHTREHNEDTFLVADLENARVIEFEHGTETIPRQTHGLLFTVADGMGGAAAGEIASAMAAQVIYSELVVNWSTTESPTPELFATCMRDATETANAKIHTFAREHPEHRGMGTTATIAGLFGDNLYIAQVGDSRAYLFRDNALTLLTRDQSLMQRLVDAGEISEEQAEASERRNIILQALGPDPAVRVDLTHQQIRMGDMLIVCSDGLLGVVKTPDIQAIAREQSDPAVLCHQLITRANEQGGPDNITVIVAHFVGNGLRSASAEEKVGRRVFPLPGTLGEDEGETEPEARPTPYKTDPTFRTAAMSGALAETPPMHPAEGGEAEQTSEATGSRKEKAAPLMMLLALLGIAAAVWLFWLMFKG